MRPALLALIIAFSAATWPPGSTAQVPQPPPAVFGAGGGGSSDGTTYLSGTLGQPVVDGMTGSNRFLGGGFWYVTDRLHIGPTSAVVVASFQVAVLDKGVELNWLIASADGLEGFNVYRSTQSRTGYIRLNDGPLLPAGVTSFVDPDIRPSQTYWYRLGAVDRDGETFSPPRSVTIPIRDVELYQNYPNPFNPTTRIDFYLPRDGRVQLVVYDVRGGKVKTLVDEPTRYGHHSVTWDGTDSRGQRASSGVYFYRLEAGNRVITKKLIVVK
jgi:hypothetical protein